MRVRVKDLLDSLNDIHWAWDKTLPMGQNVVLALTPDGKLSLISQSPDVGIECLVSPSTAEPQVVSIYDESTSPPDDTNGFHLAVRGPDLLDIVKTLKGEVDLRSDNKLQIKTEEAVIELESVPLDEQLPWRQPSGRFQESTTKILRECVLGTAYAINPKCNRENIDGMNFRLMNDGTLETMASDGHRLARIIRDEGIPSGEKVTSLIRTPAIRVLEKVLRRRKANGPAQIYPSESSLGFVLWGGEVTIRAGISEDEFPCVDSLIALDSDYSQVAIAYKPLLAAAKRAAKILTGKVRLIITGGEMTLCSPDNRDALSQDGPSYTERINLITGSDRDVEMALNPKYLVDALTHTAVSREVTVAFKKGSPILLWPTGEDERKDLALIMPMRLYG